MRVYSVYDIVGESWSPPFLQENDRSADRSFQQILRKNPESAGDMKLYVLGKWDPKAFVGTDPLVCFTAHEVTSASIMKEMENA